jgi:hypothetical protein
MVPELGHASPFLRAPIRLPAGRRHTFRGIKLDVLGLQETGCHEELLEVPQVHRFRPVVDFLSRGCLVVGSHAPINVDSALNFGGGRMRF